MLMAGASRMAFAPETDDGAEFEDLDEGFDEGEDGEEDDEQDPDDADGEDGDGDGEDGDPPPRQPTRGEKRFQTLAAKTKAAEDRAAKLEADLAEERRQRNAGPQVSPEEQARRRDAHLATLTEAGRLEFLINENRQQTAAELNQIKFASWDASDKSTFQGMCARTPAFAALETEVEQELTRLRGTGQNASRETIAYYLLGKKAASKAPRARAAGQRREQEGRTRQEGRPVNGRGDVPPNGSRRTSDREARRKRLEGQLI